MNSILKRRSIRQYKDGDITDEQIKFILRAGMSAPSAHNQQPYRFVVIKDRTILSRLAEVHAYAKMLTEAAFAMVVYYEPAGLKAREFAPLDLSAATQNMLIEATDHGIGSCWIGVYPNETLIQLVRECVGLEEHQIPFSLISFGLPAVEKHPIDRFVEEWVTYK